MSRIKTALKKNAYIRKFGKKFNVLKAYIGDMKFFNRNFIESDSLNANEYKVMLIVHSLEKGLTIENPRPFGLEKVNELLKLINRIVGLDDNNRTVEIGKSILNQWKNKMLTINTELTTPYNELIERVDEMNLSDNSVRTGVKKITNLDTLDYNTLLTFANNRQSIRNYSDKRISFENIDKAIELAKTSPSACNRQMVKSYYIDRTEDTKLIENTLMGLSGFSKATTNYFIITFDTSAFETSGERNQGYYNAGLFSMSLVYALESLGIGSCFLQWGNSIKDEELIKKKYKINEHERIATFIGLGYPNMNCVSPYSYKKNTTEILTVYKGD